MSSADKRPAPVVVLHGILRSRHSMGASARWLQRNGYEPHNLGYRSSVKSLAELGVWLGVELERRFGSDPRRVHFLTHSMGGLVVRSWLQSLAGAQPPIRMGRVVMLAPPNRGSRVAERLGTHWWFRTLYGPAGQDLRSGPECVLETMPLPRECAVVAGTRSVGLYSWLVERGTANDGTVAQDETMIDVAGGIEVPSGHTFIMNSREALTFAAGFFATGRLNAGSQAVANSRSR